MSDFRTFVDGLLAGHQSWLAAHGSPSGTEFLDHYVGDADHPDALLWRYEAWRESSGFTRVRPWNGSEGLGHVGVPDLPFPGYVVPWETTTSAAGPGLDPELAEGRTTAQLQAHFGGSGAAAIESLGAAVRSHWQAVVTFTFVDGSQDPSRNDGRGRAHARS